MITNTPCASSTSTISGNGLKPNCQLSRNLSATCSTSSSVVIRSEMSSIPVNAGTGKVGHKFANSCQRSAWSSTSASIRFSTAAGVSERLRYFTPDKVTLTGRKKYSLRTPSALPSLMSTAEPGILTLCSYFLIILALTPTCLPSACIDRLAAARARFIRSPIILASRFINFDILEIL